MAFNPTTFQVGDGTSRPLLHSLSFNANWEWSTVDPDIIYFLNGNQIAKYNKATGVRTNLGGPPNGDPVTYAAVVIGKDNWVCAAAGPGIQDSYTEIYCVNPISPGTSEFIDVYNKTINGVPQSDPNWPTSASGQVIGIHGISGGTGAKWLEVTFHQQSWGANGGAVLDLGTNTWSEITNADGYWSGHVSMGNGRYANSSGSTDGRDSRGILLRDPDNAMNSSQYLFVSQPPNTTNGWCDADHTSWLNSMTNANAPILVSRYMANTPGCAYAWTGEIYAAAVDGSNTVWRFAHNHDGGCYYGEGFAQISNDGKWALFSSYWDGTLGADASFGCQTRIDTFIVQLSADVPPTLTITKSHTGNFSRGQIGATYTITVGNLGALATTGTVTVTDTLPAGLTATAIAGTGWTCTLGTLSCQRSNALAGDSSYPAIMLTVNVAINALPSVTNSATASGGGDPNPHTANDATTIVQFPDLTITKTHTGSFTQGQSGATYKLTVSNVGAAPSSGTVTATDTLPTSLIPIAFAGTGWTCTLSPLSCQRSDALGAGGSYPTITLTVNVANDAPSSVTNTATVSGGGDVTPVDNTINDVTTVTATALTALRFVTVSPCRIMDTRAGQGFSGSFGPPFLSGNTTRTVPIPSSSCGIPSTANAYSLNATVVPHGALGYMTLWPTGEPQPLVSTLNALNGQITANAAIVPAGASGSINAYVTDDTDLILDINGYFTSGAGPALVFYPLTPCRVLDTRNSNSPLGGPILSGNTTRSFPVISSSCGIPAGAQAYVFNATVVPPGELDFLTLWPAGLSQPTVSTLNALDGVITANMAILPAGTGGSINAYVSQSSHLILDITGYFAAPGGGGALQFYALTPCRVADTRDANGTFGGPIVSGGSTRSFPVPASSCSMPATSQAYSMNATVVPSGPLGWLTVWPTGQSQPLASTLNAPDGAITANALIVPAGTGGAVSAFVKDNTQLIFDTNGYFAP